MFIYQSQPNRVYPSFATTMVKTYYNIYEFSSQYHFYTEEDWKKAAKLRISHQKNELKHIPRSKEDNINDIFLMRQIHSKSIYAIYGLFRSEFLDNFKTKNDYACSIIDDPIEQISNLYSYINFATKRVEELNKALSHTKHNLLVGGTFDYFDKYNYLSIYFREMFPTFEKYIDFIIDIKGDFKNFWMENFDIKWCFSNHFLHCSMLSKELDFIGIMSNENLLNKSLKKIAQDNNFKNMKLENYKIPPYLIKNTYRRKDLIKIFQNDIDFYNEKLKILNGI